jgi:hypothetical protein
MCLLQPLHLVYLSVSGSQVFDETLEVTIHVGNLAFISLTSLTNSSIGPVFRLGRSLPLGTSYMTKYLESLKTIRLLFLPHPIPLLLILTYASVWSEPGRRDPRVLHSVFFPDHGYHQLSQIHLFFISRPMILVSTTMRMACGRSMASTELAPGLRCMILMT